MNVMKWVRKNNRKIMAIVVILILFGFIGGGQLLQLVSRNRTEALAQYADNLKITNYDLHQARQELEVLVGLGAPMFLRSQQIGGILLGELLFSERKPQPEVANHLTQMLTRNQYRVTDQQLAAIYKGTLPGAFYWVLLSHEAQQAGITVSNTAVGQMLGDIIPQIFRDQTYAQRIRALMNSGMSESQILSTCGKLMAVLQYSQMICGNEDLTCRQLDHMISADNETLDVNAVGLEARTFTKLLDPNQPVPENRLQEHFNRFKGFYAGQITDDNPFGFGYKLPARIQVEYLVVRLDDVLPLIPGPTQEQAEDYYHRNIQGLFTKQEPTDPNDPNSPTKDVVRSFAQVAEEIQKRWISEKAIEKTVAIMQEARNQVDLPQSLIEQEGKGLNIEILKQKAPSYKPVADQLSDKHKVKIYVGQTGLLSLEDMTGDRVLNRLDVSGRSQWLLPLAKLLFAVDPVGIEDLMMVNVQKPKPYESIGPAQEFKDQRNPDLFEAAGQVVAVVRIVQVVEAREPADLNETYDNTAVALNEASTTKTFSIKEKVLQDVRQMDGFEMAKTKAREFLALATKDGWTAALNQFNQDYRQKAGLAATEPNAFALHTQAQIRGVSTGLVQMWALRSQLQDPMAQRVYRNVKAQKMFTDHLYGLIPQDGDKIQSPTILESPSESTVYCIKDLSIKRFGLQEYGRSKSMYAYQEEFLQSQSLAAIYFNPANIAQRMHYVAIREKTQPSDANNPSSN
jgi:hypothetical protein